MHQGIGLRGVRSLSDERAGDHGCVPRRDRARPATSSGGEALGTISVIQMVLFSLLLSSAQPEEHRPGGWRACRWRRPRGGSRKGGPRREGLVLKMTVIAPLKLWDVLVCRLGTPCWGWSLGPALEDRDGMSASCCPCKRIRMIVVVAAHAIYVTLKKTWSCTFLQPGALATLSSSSSLSTHSPLDHKTKHPYQQFNCMNLCEVLLVLGDHRSIMSLASLYPPGNALRP